MLYTLRTPGVKPPRIAKVAFPRLIWRIPNDENKIFLTFDDGPIPGVTEWVLDILDMYKLKATFFCVGENVTRYPCVYKEIVNRGHATGNHTYNHLNSWKTRNSKFLANVQQSTHLIDTNLFRPPYGKIKLSLSYHLKKDFKIIMWDILSKDYDSSISPELCYDNVIKNTRSGSIIVFHDSVKAFKNMKYAMPRSIEYLLNQGYNFEKIVFDA